MNNQEKPKIDQPSLMEDPMAGLEKMYIEQYLAEKGYRWCDLAGLPAGEIKILMTEACMYASARLAEMDAKVGFREEIRYR
jgi:hypothetical protein